MKIRKKNQLRKMIRTSLLALLLPVVGSVYAQVRIGDTHDPSKGALLDLVATNQDKGVLFPKVSLSKFDELTPLIANADANDEAHSIGMVVYNTNDQADGVAVGFVVWNGEEWQSLTGGGTSMSKVSAIDCSGIEIKGAYTKNNPLDVAVNKIILPVTVDRKGSYNILVEVYQGANHNLSNGYTFASSGEFYSTGLIPVTLLGQGTPRVETDDVNLDYLKIYLNGQEITCTQGSIPGIKVEKIQADYSLVCSSVKLNMDAADCVKGHDMDNDDQITVRISAPTDAAGAFYSIETNTVNGVSFKGAGFLTGGVQNVTLTGVGKIDKTGLFTYTITCNNSSNQSCTVDMSVTYNQIIKIKTFSQDNDWGLVGDNRAPALIAKNKELFGLDVDKNAVLPLSQNSLVFTHNSSSNPSDTENYNDVALVLIGYNVSLSKTAMEHLFEYVKQGGVAFICCENNNLKSMINYIPNSNVTVEDAPNPGNGTKPSLNGLVLLVGNSPAVRGYYDLKGKNLSRNGGDQRNITSYSSAWEMVAGIGSYARLIKHTQYDLYIGGDGGMLSGSASNDPARVDAQGIPQISGTNNSTTGGYNSFVLANVMLYAVQKYINAHP